MKGLRLRLCQGLLGIMTLLLLLPMVQTFLYSFASMAEMKAFLRTRGSYDASRWMGAHLIPEMVSLEQYYQILITDNTVLRLFVSPRVAKA